MRAWVVVLALLVSVPAKAEMMNVNADAGFTTVCSELDQLKVWYALISDKRFNEAKHLRGCWSIDNGTAVVPLDKADIWTYAAVDDISKHGNFKDKGWLRTCDLTNTCGESQSRGSTDLEDALNRRAEQLRQNRAK